METSKSLEELDSEDNQLQGKMELLQKKETEKIKEFHRASSTDQKMKLKEDIVKDVNEIHEVVKKKVDLEEKRIKVCEKSKGADTDPAVETMIDHAENEAIATAEEQMERLKEVEKVLRDVSSRNILRRNDTDDVDKLTDDLLNMVARIKENRMSRLLEKNKGALKHVESVSEISKVENELQKTEDKMIEIEQARIQRLMKLSKSNKENEAKIQESENKILAVTKERVARLENERANLMMKRSRSMDEMQIYFDQASNKEEVIEEIVNKVHLRELKKKETEFQMENEILKAEEELLDAQSKRVQRTKGTEESEKEQKELKSLQSKQKERLVKLARRLSEPVKDSGKVFALIKKY